MRTYNVIGAGKAKRNKQHEGLRYQYLDMCKELLTNGATVAELITQMGRSRNTVYDIIADWQSYGWIKRGENRKWVLTNAS